MKCKPLATVLSLCVLSTNFALAVDAVPKGYQLLRVTPAGRAMAINRAKPTTVRDAIEDTLNELDDYFDDDYDVFGAAANKADGKSGFATIKAKYDGHDVRGIVIARLTPTGSSNFVIFCRADAPPAALTELMNPPQQQAQQQPTQAGQPAAASGNPLDTKPANPLDSKPGNPLDTKPANPLDTAAAPPIVPSPTPVAVAPQPAPAPAEPPAPQPRQFTLSTYQFPDGTGSVGIADGWQIGQAAGAATRIVGPQESEIVLGQSLAINTPNSMAVQLARQYPVPGAVTLVAPYAQPAEALASIVPQLSRLSQSRGGPALEVDNIVVAKQLPPSLQNSQDAVLRYGVTRTQNGQSKHFQAIAQVMVCPTSNESWMLYATSGIAPDEIAQTEGPAILAMINSWQVNGQVVQQKTNNWIRDRQQWFAGQQQAHATITQAYDDQNKAWHADQLRRDRANDDWTEGFRGVTDVRDTVTGELQQTKLSDVNEVLESLNRYDPQRYEQLKLKDKLDPLPGNR